MISRLWKGFWRPSHRLAFGTIFFLGAIAAGMFLAGGGFALKQTDTIAFCISCHEMRSTVYPEYKKTAHYENASGVRVTCADCHVPKEWPAKIVRKIKASTEIYHKLMGTISTREKFEAKRLELAKRVWASLEASDSRECRNCHSYEAMAFHKQTRRGSEKMREAFKKGETCIICHKGLAHKKPFDPDEDD